MQNRFQAQGFDDKQVAEYVRSEIEKHREGSLKFLTRSGDLAKIFSASRIKITACLRVVLTEEERFYRSFVISQQDYSKYFSQPEKKALTTRKKELSEEEIQNLLAFVSSQIEGNITETKKRISLLELAGIYQIAQEAITWYLYQGLSIDQQAQLKKLRLRDATIKGHLSANQFGVEPSSLELKFIGGLIKADLFLGESKEGAVGKVFFCPGKKDQPYYEFKNGRLKFPDFKVIDQPKVIETYGWPYHADDDPQELIKLYSEINIDARVYTGSDISSRKKLADVMESLKAWIAS